MLVWATNVREYPTFTLLDCNLAQLSPVLGSFLWPMSQNYEKTWNKDLAAKEGSEQSWNIFWDFQLFVLFCFFHPKLFLADKDKKRFREMAIHRKKNQKNASLKRFFRVSGNQQTPARPSPKHSGQFKRKCWKIKKFSISSFKLSQMIRWSYRLRFCKSFLNFFFMFIWLVWDFADIIIPC